MATARSRNSVQVHRVATRAPESAGGRPRPAPHQWQVALTALLSMLIATGCAGPGAIVVNTDLDRAEALAKAAGDDKAIACYVALAKANTVSVAGLFTTIEQARILRMARGPCAEVLLP